MRQSEGVRAFACDVCNQLVFFENSVCVSCGSALGFSRQLGRVVALDAGGTYALPDGRLFRVCGNLDLAACTWLVDVDAGSPLCDCCRLTRTRPADDDVRGLEAFARTEAAKRRLVFQLDVLGLPVVGRDLDPTHGLAFDLLSSAEQPVVTGHDDGLITLDLAEGDDGYRESLRVRLDEPYRTLLGHLRHEVGHYYWQTLVESGGPIEDFRALFGDERADYAQALQEHYSVPAPVDWNASYVSGYATAHPWEDWAETFAHYLHIRDTLQTASAYGLWIGGPDAPVRPDPDVPLATLPTETAESIDDIIAMWLPLTYALNQVNRSMGRDDLYPFVLAPRVVDKLGFVHRLVHAYEVRSELRTA
jgi:hypothetical protein